MNQYERLGRRLARISHKEYLMHGSTKRKPLHGLTPQKQRIIFPNRPQLTRTRVYATAYIPIALVYAIIRLPSEYWDWQLIKTDGNWIMYCRMRCDVPVCHGYVYIVPRKSFKELGGPLICSSFRRVSSIRRVRVPASTLRWLIDQGTVRIVDAYPERERQ